MDPATITALSMIAPTLFGFLTGGGGQEIPHEQRMLMTSQRRAIDTENALQQLVLARRRAQDPLWRAVQQMAMMRLPIFAKQGMSFDFSEPVNVPPVTTGGSRPRQDQDITGYAVPRT